METEKDYKVGYGKPPVNRQFGRPEGNKRREGFWDIHATARYKLEQMMKLNVQELARIAEDTEAPVFERRIAKNLLKETDWKITEGMINQVYGQPKEKKELDITGEISGINVNIKKYEAEK